MRPLNMSEMQAVTGASAVGDLANLAAHEIGASVLGGVTAGIAGAIIGGRHGGDGGGILGVGAIGQLVGLVGGGLIGLGFGAIAAPLVGWDATVQYAEGAVQGIINGTLG